MSYLHCCVCSCSRHRIVISEHVKVAYYKPLHDAEVRTEVNLHALGPAVVIEKFPLFRAEIQVSKIHPPPLKSAQVF